MPLGAGEKFQGMTVKNSITALIILKRDRNAIHLKLLLLRVFSFPHESEVFFMSKKKVYLVEKKNQVIQKYASSQFCRLSNTLSFQRQLLLTAWCLTSGHLRS